MSEFREIKPNDKGYPGFTSLPLNDGKAISALGYGPAVRNALRRAAADRK